MNPEGLTEPSLDKRFTDTYKRVKSAKVWTDPQKVKQLEKQLKQLERMAVRVRR